MQARELDTTYTSLAQAIDQAGSNSELFLAMLCLKLAIDVGDSARVEHSIQAALQELQKHGTAQTDRAARQEIV